MTGTDINSKTYFFTVNHITKEKNNKLIYGISLNNTSYFLSKTSGVKDIVQLDNKPHLIPDVLKELNEVITSVELKYKKRLSLETLNKEIFGILMRLRHLSISGFKIATT
jgi:hypothetical protein